MHPIIMIGNQRQTFDYLVRVKISDPRGEISNCLVKVTIYGPDLVAEPWLERVNVTLEEVIL